MNFKYRVSATAKKEPGIVAWFCLFVAAEVTAILLIQIASLLGVL